MLFGDRKNVILSQPQGQILGALGHLKAPEIPYFELYGHALLPSTSHHNI